MHYSAKRGLAIACRPSVCNVGGSWPHTWKILELHEQLALRSPKHKSGNISETR